MKMFFIVSLFISIGSQGFAVEIKEDNRIMAEVSGIVCSFCAYGIEKNLSKLEFIDSSFFGDGILVDVKNGFITMAINPSKEINISKIAKSIKKGGYVFKVLHLRLTGTITKDDTSTVLKNEINGQEFYLLNVEGGSWNPGKQLGEIATVQGMIPKLKLLDKNLDSKIFVQVKPISKNEE